MNKGWKRICLLMWLPFSYIGAATYNWLFDEWVGDESLKTLIFLADFEYNAFPFIINLSIFWIWVRLILWVKDGFADSKSKGE